MIPFEELASLFNSSLENRNVIRLDFDGAAYLYKLIKSLEKPSCIEIGRLFGGTTRLMLSAGAFTITIDNLSDERIEGSEEYDADLKAWSRTHRLDDMLTILTGDSTSFSCGSTLYLPMFLHSVAKILKF